MNDEIFNALLGRLGERLVQQYPGSTPPSASEPAPTPATSPAAPEPAAPTRRAEAIAAIISQSYSMPGVPDSVKKRCAKHRIEEEYGVEEARKYLRTNKKKVAVPVPAQPETPAAAPTPTSSVNAIPLFSPPSAAKTESPVITINEEMRKLMMPAQQAESETPTQ